MQGRTFKIGELWGGGLVLGYRCPSRCRHCLYGCGPHRNDGEPPDTASLERILDLLAERAPRAALHIGGGEPFLNVDRLEHAISGMRKRGLGLEYVETNASWVRDVAHGEQVLARLAEAGLSQVLISLSPFHAEFVPPAKTTALIRAASSALPSGAFIWIPAFLAELQEVPAEQRMDLDALLAREGDAYARALAARYSLVPAGRAGRYLHKHGARFAWSHLLDRAPCRERLADTTHFHVDGEGRYVPGLCAGIGVPLSEVPGELALERYPVLDALVSHGLRGLVEMARKAGFEPQATYSSPCDLCCDARRTLFAQGYPELGPSGFYDPKSLGDSTG